MHASDISATVDASIGTNNVRVRMRRYNLYFGTAIMFENYRITITIKFEIF